MKLKSWALLALVLLLAVGCDYASRLLPTTTSPQATIESSVTLTYRIVQPDDTLSKIAAQYGTTVETLIALNRDRYPGLETNPSLIHVGWELLVPASGEIEVTPVAETGVFDPVVTENYIVEMVNEARVEAGLSPLVVDPELVEIARERSQDMIARDYFGHYDPQTGEPLAKVLLEEKGYTNFVAGENIVLMQTEFGLALTSRFDSYEVARQFVEGWLNSPQHRENIMHAQFTKTGVGLAISSDGQKIIATQIFLE